MAKCDLSGVQTVLRNLKKFTSEGNEISSLTALNKIISSQEGPKFLHNSDWILFVMSLLESNTTASDICLKILLNASKKYEEVRRKLIKNKIFYLLNIRLRGETDFWKSNLILYSALMVVLVQGNKEAQNQMRISGCLSSIVNILSFILDEANNKPLPFKNTELLIYTIIASNKNPHHPQNQTEIGWIIPKVLDYLESQTSFFDSQQLQVVKSFWFFLKIAIDKNEANQYIFLSSSGVSVLFRSIQDVMDDHNRDDLLAKMTGILLKMRRNKDFLFQASHYCPVMILCDVLKTYNYLVVQQIVIFLDSLTKEFPQTLQIMKTKEVRKRMKKAKMIITKSKTTAELSQHLWKRLEIYDEVQTSQEESTESSFVLSEDVGVEFANPFCVVHGSGENSPVYSNYIFPTDKNQISNEIGREKGEKSVSAQLNYVKGRRGGYNFGRRVAFVLKKILSFFVGRYSDNFYIKCIR